MDAILEPQSDLTWTNNTWFLKIQDLVTKNEIKTRKIHIFGKPIKLFKYLNETRDVAPFLNVNGQFKTKFLNPVRIARQKRSIQILLTKRVCIAFGLSCF